MRRFGLGLAALVLAAPAWGQGFDDPQPLSMPQPLGQATPLSRSGPAGNVPLIPDPPLMGGAPAPARPRGSGQSAQRSPGDMPCPPSRPAGTLSSGGSGPGEYGSFVPSAGTEAEATRPAKPERRVGMGRPLGAGVDRPLWGSPGGSARGESQGGAQGGVADPGPPVGSTGGQAPRRSGDQDPITAQEAAGRPDNTGCPARPPRDPNLLGR